MQRISSKDNNLIKHLKKLKEKKYRDEYGEYTVEGIKLVKEAFKEKANIKQLIICDGCNSEIIESHLKYEMAKFDFVYVPENIFKMISNVVNPQGVLAVIGKNTIDVANKDNISLTDDIILALDDIQDPGNLGTILRTADSVGLKQILISKGTADPYNPKVVRSTMGAIFRINIIECDNLKEILEYLHEKNYKIMCTSLEAKETIYQTNYNKKVIVIGNEANGVSKDIQKMADEKVIIPMLGKTESLNASVATGVILYEYVRQKLI